MARQTSVRSHTKQTNVKYQKGDILYHRKFDCYWEFVRYDETEVIRASLIGFPDRLTSGLIEEYVSLSKHPKEYALVMNRINPPLRENYMLLYRNGTEPENM